MPKSWPWGQAKATGGTVIILAVTTAKVKSLLSRPWPEGECQSQCWPRSALLSQKAKANILATRPSWFQTLSLKPPMP